MVEKILTPIIYGLIATMVSAIVFVLLVAEPGPVLWIIMAVFGVLGFISGIVRVRRGPKRADQPGDKTD
jgi:hypothetical protein